MVFYARDCSMQIICLGRFGFLLMFTALGDALNLCNKQKGEHVIKHFWIRLGSSGLT